MNQDVRRCFVPNCRNDSEKQPQKKFFPVPRNLTRKKEWFKSAKIKFSNRKTLLFCCEDHFNLEVDSEAQLSGKNLPICMNQFIAPNNFSWSTTKLQSAELIKNNQDLKQPNIKSEESEVWEDSGPNKNFSIDVEHKLGKEKECVNNIDHLFSSNSKNYSRDSTNTSNLSHTKNLLSSTSMKVKPSEDVIINPPFFEYEEREMNFPDFQIVPQDVYKCPYCNFNSRQEIDLRKHQAIEKHYGNRFSCPICKIADTLCPTTFDTHMFERHKHEADEIVPLNIVRKYRRGLLQIKLMKIRNFAIELNIYSCKRCHYECTRWIDLKNHQNNTDYFTQMNSEGKIESKVIVYACGKCGVKSCQKVFLQVHRCKVKIGKSEGSVSKIY